MKKSTRRNPLKHLLPLILLGSLLSSPLWAQDATPECGELPSDIFLMLDRTGSVRDAERAKEAEAAKTLVQLLLENTDNRVALGAFGSENCLPGFPASTLSELNENQDELFQAIDAGMRDSSCGGTNLADPIQLASVVLDQGQNSNRIFILISDGDPNFPRETPGPRQAALDAAARLKDEGVRIFTIAFDAGQVNDETNRATLAQMASHISQDDSQGMVEPEEQALENQDEDDFFIAPRAEDLERVFKNIGEIILCDDQDPCTQDRCNDTGRCEYVIKDSCLANPPPEDSESCGTDSCPSKIFQESPEPLLEEPLHQTPNLSPGMVQGGGMACALGAPWPGQDLGAILLGCLGLWGGLMLLRRPE